MRIERPSCPVCKSTARQNPVSNGSVTWMECCGCGLTYQIAFDRIVEVQAYLEGKVPTYNPQDKKIRDYNDPAKVPGFQKRYKRLTKLSTTGTCVIELGFGGGLLLRELVKSKRWDWVVGIEVSSHYVEHARQMGVEAYHTDITEGCPKGLIRVADLVVANEVMEHMERPVEWVMQAIKMLKPDGILAVSFAAPEGRQKLSSSELQYWSSEAICHLMSCTRLDAETSVVRRTAPTRFFAWFRKVQT